MPAELTLLVCEHLARETAAAVDAPGFDAVRVDALPARCDATAAERAELVRDVAARLERCASACVVGGGCLRGVALEDAGGRLVGVLRRDTCFELLAGRARVERWLRAGTHLVTPGWLARWRERLRRWGLDRRAAAALFAESTTRLLLVDTGLDPRAREELRALAAHLGLPADVAAVGIDRYRRVLRGTVRALRAGRARLRGAAPEAPAPALAAATPAEDAPLGRSPAV